MKKSISLVLIILVTLVFSVCDAAPTGDKVYNLKLSHTGAPNHHYQIISTKFSDLVKERTNGEVVITVFPADQLGKQEALVQGAMMGTTDIVLTSDNLLSNWVPELNALNLPFIFRDNAHLRAVVDGPVGEKLAKLVELKGVVVLGWWDNGFCHITNSTRPITTPSDLKGLKIRVPQGEVLIDTFKAMGTAPTPIPFGELYSSLQLKTVDGQMNPVAHILTQKFYEVQKYASMTFNTHYTSPLLISKSVFVKLPKKDQDVLLKTGMELGAVHTKMVADLEEEQWKQLKEKGLIVNQVKRQPFVDSVKPVYEKWRKKIGADIIDAIVNTK